MYGAPMRLRVARKVCARLYDTSDGGLGYRLVTIKRALRRVLGAEAITELPPPPVVHLLWDR
jgi:hypothetical protein